VPTEIAIVQEARASGVEIIGEVELAYRFCDAPMCAVTGTCGKGTTVTALGAMLSQAEVANVVAGNIGLPLISQMDRSSELAVVVAEISSFQLETTTHLRPSVAVLLNITEDHLERYRDFTAYAEAKRVIFRNQTEEDWAIFCVDDPRAREMYAGMMGAGATGGPSLLTVSLDDPDANGRLEGESLVLQMPGSEGVPVAEVSELPLRGRHHVGNFLAAGLAALICGVPAEAMAPALRGYQAASHLMTRVAEVGGVAFIDDSKATNPASAIADLSGIEGPVVVIAGGKEKDTDFSEFGRALASRAEAVILMGECAKRIAQAVGTDELCHRVSSMDEAVRLAWELSRPGYTVALCPACSSLDMFESYAARGDQFAAAVGRLEQ